MGILTESFVVGLTVALLVLGLIGSIVPILPGQLISFGALLFYGFYNGWQTPSLWIMVMLLLVTAFTASSDFWLPAMGSQKTGGKNKYAIIYGIIGAIAGMFSGFVFGAILGYAVGVFLGSYQVHRNKTTAWNATKGSLLGQGAAMTLQFLGGIVVLALFVFTVYGEKLL